MPFLSVSDRTSEALQKFRREDESDDDLIQRLLTSLRKAEGYVEELQDALRQAELKEA